MGTPTSTTLPTFLALGVAIAGTLLTMALSVLYLRHVRMERPAIGTFNGVDVVVVFGFIVVLPLLYLVLPLTPLLVVLGLTFTSALVFGLRPVLGPAATWIVVGVVIAANIWMGRTMLGTVVGWQLFWIENDLLVVGAAVATANLYVQGGMRLRHVAWFGLVLAVYDAVFTFVWPITNTLAQRFIGWPFDPSVGFRIGIYNATIGLGDLLIYSLFVIAALKAYGPRAARGAAVISVLCGAVVPALLPLITDVFIDARTDVIVPAQAAFGPAAFLYYRWLRRTYGAERTMAGFLGRADVDRQAPTPSFALSVP
ncbi:hypothetical protein Cch01nite_24330 [Cellulomonas chitinilytica]|uniref:Uncharacterized protein n=1 Tax=Cellulomonas chitinilytica TaxID=398759 RepID=A0A919P5F6_9CELL|nr:hypothetical protein [Cellulomonas chitinilytica]GIG21709.1 hypothetical protein Cch01nite_24330 [Cellulomonas chitinilytica]